MCLCVCIQWIIGMIIWIRMDNMQFLELFVFEMDKNIEILFPLLLCIEKYKTIVGRKYLNYIQQYQILNSWIYTFIIE